MEKKGRVACYMVGPRAGSSRAAPRGIMPHEFSDPRQNVTLSLEPPFCIPSDHIRPLERLFGPLKDRHVNRDELRDNHKRAQRPRKFEWAKNQVIYSLSDVPCAKERQTKKGQLS